MVRRNERLDDLSLADAKALLKVVEGPLLEIVLSMGSADICAADVPGQAVVSLASNPLFSSVFLTDDEQAAWERFKVEHGDGPKEIGEFVYGPDANPWAP